MKNKHRRILAIQLTKCTACLLSDVEIEIIFSFSLFAIVFDEI
jgi:hypothetical protein